MPKTEQQDIGRAMHIQVIDDRMEAFDLRRHSCLDVSEEINPVIDRAPEVIPGQRFAGRRTKRAKDVAFPTSPIINLLFRTLNREPWISPGKSANQLCPGQLFAATGPISAS